MLPGRQTRQQCDEIQSNAKSNAVVAWRLIIIIVVEGLSSLLQPQVMLAVVGEEI